MFGCFAGSYKNRLKGGVWGGNAPSLGEYEGASPPHLKNLQVLNRFVFDNLHYIFFIQFTFSLKKCVDLLLRCSLGSTFFHRHCPSCVRERCISRREIENILYRTSRTVQLHYKKIKVLVQYNEDKDKQDKTYRTCTVA